MLHRLRIRNFKRFRDVEIELGDPVVFVGPNNAGKSSALQAIALWHTALQTLAARRGAGTLPDRRPGVVINRRDLAALPVPNTLMLWPDKRVSLGKKGAQQKIRVEVEVEGERNGEGWFQGVEVDYANPESVNVRPLRTSDELFQVSEHAVAQQVALLMPMSGLVDREYLKEPGQVAVEIGQGRTAEVLRNLLFQVHQRGDDAWGRLVEAMRRLFGVELGTPARDARAELTVTYQHRPGAPALDLSCSGRGMQQTLLVLSWLHLNRGGALLLDEPDAHLEVLRQREMWLVLRDEAAAAGSQIIAATHSEKLLEHVARTDVVVAFVGRPHRVDDRGSQLRKALMDIGFEDYLLAEQRGWVLYVEGESDVSVLRAFARRLGHPAADVIDRAFFRTIGNVIARAREHFHGLREAVPDLEGLAVIDLTDVRLQDGGPLGEHMWTRRELENYLATPETLIAWARARDGEQLALFAPRLGDGAPAPAVSWEASMRLAMREIEDAAAVMDERPWAHDTRGSATLETVMKRLFHHLGRPYEVRKRSWYELADYVPLAQIDDEVIQVLDKISALATRAEARRPGDTA